MTIWLGWMCMLPLARTQILDIVWNSQPYHQLIEENSSAYLSFSVLTEAPMKDLNNFKAYFDLQLLLFHEASGSHLQCEPTLRSITESAMHFTCQLPFDDLQRGRSLLDVKITSKQNGENWYLHDFTDLLPSLNAGKLGFRNAALHYDVNDRYSLDYALRQKGLALAEFPDQLGGIFTQGFCKNEVISLSDLMVQIWSPTGNNGCKVELHLIDEENQTSSILPLSYLRNGIAGEALNPYFTQETLLSTPGITEELYRLDIISNDLLAEYSNAPGEHTLSFFLSLNHGEEQVRLPENGHFSARFTIANAPVGADCQAALLPIELLDFLVIGQKDEVFLKWISALEINNQFYAIERSPDALEWTTIYEIHGKGNSVDYITYTYTDHQPFPGINYYRLKQMDFDGSMTYSKVKTIRIKSSSIQLHPNPVNRFLYYKIDDPNQKYEVKVYNIQGECLFERIIPDPASQFHRIDFSSIPKGTYILKYINQENYLSRTAKLVKL
jgi:hypothetical protein